MWKRCVFSLLMLIMELLLMLKEEIPSHLRKAQHRRQHKNGAYNLFYFKVYLNLK